MTLRSVDGRLGVYGSFVALLCSEAGKMAVVVTVTVVVVVEVILVIWGNNMVDWVVLVMLCSVV